MTTPISVEVAKRRKGAPRKPRTVAELASRIFARRAVEAGAIATAQLWPSSRYRREPVTFFREILGVEPWDKQVELIEAVRDHPRVSVSSGHKVSKSHSLGGIALWFYCSFDDARVVMSSTTSRQVDQILWRELKMMHSRAGRCAACKAADKERIARREQPGPRPCPHSALIDGEPRELARTGLKSAPPDWREVVGFTAREAEAVAGISGKNLLYLLDEASGIPRAIFEAIEGNRAGGARVVMTSNPTKVEGEFFDSFHGKARFYKTMRISSEDTPNVRLGREVIPGLATLEWVNEKRQEWGEESALYQIRVRGNFVLREDGKVISVHMIGEAEKRWDATPAEGRLQIGLDPAGEGEDGDESALSARRGRKITRLVTHRAQTAEALLVHTLGLIKEERRDPHEKIALVVVDGEGAVGARVAGTFRAYADAHPDAFELHVIRSSNEARDRDSYELIRDELWASLRDWLRDEEGAIPEDTKLAKDMNTPWWEPGRRNRSRIPPKKALKKELGRSPDRGDAVCLSVWNVSSLAEEDDAGAQKSRARPDDEDTGIIDPRNQGGLISPYGDWTRDGDDDH